MMCRQILEEAKKMYPVHPSTPSPSSMSCSTGSAIDHESSDYTQSHPNQINNEPVKLPHTVRQTKNKYIINILGTGLTCDPKSLVGRIFYDRTPYHVLGSHALPCFGIARLTTLSLTMYVTASHCIIYYAL